MQEKQSAGFWLSARFACNVELEGQNGCRGAGVISLAGRLQPPISGTEADTKGEPAEVVAAQ